MLNRKAALSKQSRDREVSRKEEKINVEESVAPAVSPPTQKNNTTDQDSQWYINSHQPSAHHAHRAVQPTDTSTPAQQENTSKLMNSAHKRVESTLTPAQQDQLKNSVHQKVEQENHVQSQKRVSPKKPPQSSSDSSGPVWKKARKQLDDLLSQVEAPPTATPTAVVGVTDTDLVGTTKSQVHRPKPKPVTKHLNMTAGMERRSAEIAKRRLAREQRREAKMRERAEQLAREEEEQRMAEAALKEAKLKQKREERQLAKQRELEKLERQRLLAEKMTKASTHYQTAQLRWRGFVPWKRFMEEMKAGYHEADRLRERALTRETWSKWWRIVMEKEREREAIATAHNHKALLKRSLAAWLKFRQLGIELECLAELHRPRLLLQRVFLCWAGFVREERREEWEKMARARRFRQRQVQCSVLRAWRGYVPVAREEREREKRREQLRRKVASWLTDYQPSKHSTVTNTEEQ